MILVDTGAWLALADKGDAYHSRLLRKNATHLEPLMATYHDRVDAPVCGFADGPG